MSTQISFAEFYATLIGGLDPTQVEEAFEIKLIGTVFTVITCLMGRDCVVAEYDFALGTGSFY